VPSHQECYFESVGLQSFCLGWSVCFSVVSFLTQHL